MKPNHKRSNLAILLFGSLTILLLCLSQGTRLSFSALHSAAWDGSSHQALAELYSTQIFPDTFGWTDAAFSGLPFPNFYPPAQVWLAALLHHSHLFSFATAFKLAVLLPIFLLPSAIWLAAWEMTGRNTLAASSAAIISLFLLADSRFYLRFNSGIDLFSTLQLGLYAQSLGFILLILWLSLYLSNLQAWRRPGLTAIALAFTILANFFAALTAFVFVAAMLLCDGWKGWRAIGSCEFRPTFNRLLVRLVVVLVGVLLALFWLVPMFTEYQYLVTRPNIVSLNRYFSPLLWVYCVIALIGFASWRRKPSPSLWPYLGGCSLLAVALLFSSTVAPGWFPLQAPRFLAMLMFLLTVPVGHALAAAFRQLAKLLGEVSGKSQAVSLIRVRYTASIALAGLVLAGFTSPGTKIQYSFYTPAEFSEIAGILDFAKERRNGRYLVEVPPQRETRARFDGRAINAYLAAQGNETLSSAYHEASVNSLFFLPVVNTLSGAPYHFGISSVLADDLDFIDQPLAQHLARARLIGTRYLVIHTPEIKFHLAQEPAIGQHQDFGAWSVFELKDSPPPRARVLPYRPALVVSDFTVKERRRNESSFIRWAEEQFADGWFDVLLVRAPEKKLDRLPGLDNFGALVLDTYDCDDCNQAFARLREFAGKKLLVVLASNAPLFQRIKAARAEFTRLEIIERQPETAGERVNSSFPTYHYNASQIRREWIAIRHALELNRVPTFATPDGSSIVAETVPVEMGNASIKLNYTPVNQVVGSPEPAPILLATTFHPKWRRTDGGSLYAATPFYMLTFADRPVTLTFSRQWQDRAALWVSASALAGLVCFTAWSALRRKLLSPS